jgi:hypothetical protein
LLDNFRIPPPAGKLGDVKRGRKITLIVFTVLIGAVLAGVAGFLSGGGFSSSRSASSRGASGSPLAGPDREAILALVDGTMKDFARAIAQKDFTDFYGNVSATWRKQTTAKDIAAAFESFAPFSREVKASVDSGPPTLNAKPLINEKKALVIQGFYPIETTKMLFSLQYVHEASGWKLLGMNIEVK